jgi:hypothetical protein
MKRLPKISSFTLFNAEFGMPTSYKLDKEACDQEAIKQMIAIQR